MELEVTDAGYTAFELIIGVMILLCFSATVAAVFAAIHFVAKVW